MKTLAFVMLITGGLFAFGGEISDIYHKQPLSSRTNDRTKSRSHDQVASTNHGISEIGIERTGCFGECPSYTFILKNDGTFRYKGHGFVERKGEITGKISEWHFRTLAQYIHDSGYMELQSTYSRDITDLPTVFTTVVMNGKRKVISNYANSGPIKLWAIEELIDRLMDNAEWGTSSKTPDKKK